MTTATARPERPTARAEYPPYLPLIDGPGVVSAGFYLGEQGEKGEATVQLLSRNSALYLHGTPARLRGLAEHLNKLADWHERRAAAAPPPEPDRDEDGDTVAEPTPEAGPRPDVGGSD